ncbi:c-type cytochrome [Denitromonas ohlonensis]|uniref:Cytochrome c n=2 Tax=Denitromonas TaxID=139331 RepID=A0A557RBV7_9RHOO|nr:cytochrome c [Denitromonas ohlonensis]TVO62652.1 cytochrome c [Denitromonas ohlonensis]TVO78856.1 cytochrome c [Denitromonas ohlonensis]
MKTLGLAMLASAVLVACGDPPATATAPATDAALAQGATLYAAQCASCHGANGEGQPDWRERKPDGRLPAPPHDASGHTWHHPMDMLFQMTRDGMVPPLAPEGYQSDMPAFGHILSDDEIRAVLAYIESQWPDEVKQMRAERFKPQTSGR